MKKTLTFFVTTILLLSSGIVLAHEGHDMDTKDKKEDAKNIREIDVITEKINDKTRYSPSLLIVKSGETVRVKMFNATDKPHGFSIDEFNVHENLQPNDNVIEFKAGKPGLYKIYCQYHPAHLTGQILVIN